MYHAYLYASCALRPNHASTAESDMEAIQDFPAFDPVAAIVIAVTFPGLIIAVLAGVWRHHTGDSYVRSCSQVIIKRAGVLSLINFIFALFICLNQASCILRQMGFGTDISYYLKVDLPAYDAFETLSNAVTLNSYNAILASYKRKLLTGSSFAVVYHTNNWDNLLTNTELESICQTERNIASNVHCLDYSSYASLIPAIFDMQTCAQTLTNQKQLDDLFSSFDSSMFLQDNVDSNNPKSSIVVSFASLGSCGSYSVVDMRSMLNNNAVDGVEVVFVNNDFMAKEFLDSIMNALTLSVIALLASIGLLVACIRGVVCGLVTVVVILMSIVTAGGLLPVFGYSEFSAFNVMSVFILVGVGANSVLLFSSSWLSDVSAGDVIGCDELLAVYHSMGAPTLFTLCAACLSLFSKLASPVIVISQLGAFMGTAVLFFYAEFHYIILPVWLCCNRWPLPASVHEQWRQCRRSLCGSSSQSDAELQTQQGLLSQDDRLDALAQAPRDLDKDKRRCTTILSKKTCGVTVLQVIGVTMLILSLLGFFLVYYFASVQYIIDFGIPQLFSPSTNVGEALLIMKTYRSDLLGSSSSGGGGGGGGTAAPTFAPTRSPTPQPTFIARPTPAPTAQPTVPSPPTAAPTTDIHAPTAAPTVRPSRPPTNTDDPTTSAAYTDYTVTGCWGLDFSKQYKDSTVTVEWSLGSFTSYSHTTASAGDDVWTVLSSSGVISDVKALCNYVANNRDLLNINPAWDDQDCIYNQLHRLAVSVQYRLQPLSQQQSVGNLLRTWTGANPSISGDFAGFQSDPSTISMSPDVPGSIYYPIWLCANFSVESPVSSLVSRPDLASEMMDRWTTAFSSQGGAAAADMGVTVLVGSDAFTLPLLASEVLKSIELAGLISVLGFVVLIFVFTTDVFMTCVGSVVMMLIMAVTLCLHLYVSSETVDLLDVVVLVAIIGMIVDFPIHMMKFFIHQRRLVQTPEAVWAAVKYMSVALFPPLLLTVVSGVPLLFATLALLRKTGEYIIIMACVSYFITVVIFPGLLGLWCECCNLSRLYGARSYSGLNKDDNDDPLDDQFRTSFSNQNSRRDSDSSQLLAHRDNNQLLRDDDK